MKRLAVTLLALLSIGCASPTPRHCQRALFMAGHVEGMIHALELVESPLYRLVSTRDQVDHAVALCGWEPREWRYDELLTGVD